MPVYIIPVTLGEVLEVQGSALNDSELWALLYATSQSLSFLFTQGNKLCVQLLSVHGGSAIVLRLCSMKKYALCANSSVYTYCCFSTACAIVFVNRHYCN